MFDDDFCCGFLFVDIVNMYRIVLRDCLWCWLFVCNFICFYVVLILVNFSVISMFVRISDKRIYKYFCFMSMYVCSMGIGFLKCVV